MAVLFDKNTNIWTKMAGNKNLELIWLGEGYGKQKTASQGPALQCNEFRASMLQSLALTQLTTISFWIFSCVYRTLVTLVSVESADSIKPTHCVSRLQLPIHCGLAHPHPVWHMKIYTSAVPAHYDF